MWLCTSSVPNRGNFLVIVVRGARCAQWPGCKNERSVLAIIEVDGDILDPEEGGKGGEKKRKRKEKKSKKEKGKQK